MSQPTIIVCGNLGADAVQRQSADGYPYHTFSVASNQMDRGIETTTWFGVAVFGAYGAAVGPRLLKGVRVVVQGDLRPLRAFERADGTTGYALDVTARKIDVLTPPPPTPAVNGAVNGAAEQPAAVLATNGPDAVRRPGPSEPGAWDADEDADADWNF